MRIVAVWVTKCFGEDGIVVDVGVIANKCGWLRLPIYEKVACENRYVTVGGEKIYLSYVKIYHLQW